MSLKFPDSRSPGCPPANNRVQQSLSIPPLRSLKERRGFCDRPGGTDWPVAHGRAIEMGTGIATNTLRAGADLILVTGAVSAVLMIRKFRWGDTLADV